MDVRWLHRLEQSMS